MATKKGTVAKAVDAVQRFTTWSFSRFKDHRTCPRFAHWRHILKKPEGPKSPAMERGSIIHKEGEDYLNGKKKSVPASYKVFAKPMQELRKLKATAEGKWALTRDWTPVDFFDWSNAWVRLVLDARVWLPQYKKARVIDFKTGRIYDDNEEQMELYAIGAFANYAEAETVDVELWYLDQPLAENNPLVKTYTKRQLPGMQKKWRVKATPLLMDKRFVPNPGPHCSRCAYSRRKGGECEY